MIGLLLVSHGKMADGMVDSVKLIMGEQENVASISLVAGEDFEKFKETVSDKIYDLDNGDGVLVYVDLFGASPYNATMLSLQDIHANSVQVRVLTGMNLPMILEILAMREFTSLADLAQLAVQSGRDGIQEPVSDLLNNVANDADEDGDY